MNPNILERNLLALSVRDPLLSTRIARAEDPLEVRFLRSRSGHEVVCLERNGQFHPLHSLVDPVREGKRFLETISAQGFFVFLGFGCGYQILPFIERTEVSTLVVLDTGLELFRAVFSRIDLHKLLLDPRVQFLIDPSPEEINQFLLSRYIPAISGDMKTIPLRSRVDLDPGFFQSCMGALRQGIETLSDDFTVQTHFGKKWFTNSLLNLKVAEKSTCMIQPRRKALVTAAGPSLEDQIEDIRKNRTDGLLIATDTSLPVLRANRILPDVVISIDCQHISYNHFMNGFPQEVPLLLDLASPPVLSRLARKVMFFSSPHPFSRYISTHWRPFPAIDTSGGNVSHAAISLAVSLGSQDIFLYGADFSFPRGKSYARGSYLYPYLDYRSSRFQPLESHFVHFLFRNQVLEKRIGEEGLRYTTKPMISYKERLEETANKLPARIIPVKGKGEPIHVPANPSISSSFTPRLLAAGVPSSSWQEFLTSYLHKTKALPDPSNPVISYLDSLSQDQRNLWTTLLPITAVLRRRCSDNLFSPAELLIQSREWAVKKIEQHLHV